jgi:UDPglucose--hexose-1-phosphate uridylyltransferase
LKLNEDPHRRLNALTNEWVLVSPHRATRPWQGEIAGKQTTPELTYDPTCYLCPGNTRAGGIRNAAYSSTFVFENDFAALKIETRREHLDVESMGLLIAEGEPGVCRVICFSPRHDLTLATMRTQEIELVVDTWAGQFRELGGLDAINHVQIFENRGAMMGASNPHPHCQIWSSHALPNEVAKEQSSQLAWNEARGACLLCDYAKLEQTTGERIVEENDEFLTVVPFWAVWPFETMVISKRHLTSIDELSDAGRDGLAEILKRTTARYDRLFQVSFPYSMGIHQKPTDGSPHAEWHLHLHFYPPLLRSATVRKFLVGYEMLATPQRDITPEAAAERLREV